MRIDDAGFAVALTERDDLSVVAVCGEVDIAVTDDLWAAVQSAVSPDRRLVIDLTSTSFMDSSGLTVLVRAQRLVEDLGGSLTVLTSPGRVRKVLSISGLDQKLNVDPVESEPKRELRTGSHL